MDVSSPKMLPEVPGFWRREGLRAGLCLSLPALPHISSWLLKMRGNASNEGRKSVNHRRVAVLRRILLRMCGEKRERLGPEQ